MENLYLYRYFNDISDPFKSILDIGLDSSEQYVDFINKMDLPCKEIYDIGYFNNRTKYEQLMKEKFLSIGGYVEKNSPTYFTLECADDWFKGRKAYKYSIALPLSLFSFKDITFTYGDSYPVFKHQGDTSLIYTIDNVEELLNREKFPFFPKNTNSYINYIEAQIWNEQIIKLYRPNYNYFSKDWMKHIELLSLAMLNTNIALRKLKPYVFTNETRDYFAYYMKHVENKFSKIPQKYIPMGEIHGKNHLLKVAILTLVLLIMDGNFNNVEILSAIDAALCHDLGRINKGNHLEHANLGLNIYHQIFNDRYSKDVETIISYHDKTRTEIKNDIHNERIRRLIEVVQDADSLDYIRFGANKFSINKLRNSFSRQLICLAMELNIVTFAYYKSPLEYLIHKVMIND